VALVAVLDADKEGFLRSHTSLVQTAGRAARHEKGRVIFYADHVTDSIQRTLDVTLHRRERQIAYNLEHGITPRGIRRGAQASLRTYDGTGREPAEAPGVAEAIEDEMQEAAGRLEFERAAGLRDQINALKSGEYKKGTKGRPRRR